MKCWVGGSLRPGDALCAGYSGAGRAGLQVMYSYYCSGVPGPGREWEFNPDPSLQSLQYYRCAPSPWSGSSDPDAWRRSNSRLELHGSGSCLC